MEDNVIKSMLEAIKNSLNEAYDEYVKEKLNDLERELETRRDATIYNIVKDTVISHEYNADTGFNKLILEFKPRH